MSAADRGRDDWSAVVDTLDVPIVLLRLDGTVLQLNRAARDGLGRRLPVAVGENLPVHDLAPPWSQVGELLAHLRESDVATSTSRDHATGGGWQISARRYASPEGERRAAVVLRDLRGGPTAPAPAGPNDRMVALGALVAGVAHEVRGPLFGISATLDAFEARFGSAGGHLEYVQALREEVGRLKGLMQDLLDYGNASSVTLTPGDVAEVLAQVERRLAPAAAAAGVALRGRVEGVLPPVLLDQQRLGQALENLVANALQHAPPGTMVEVVAREGTVEEAQVAADQPAFWRLALEGPAAPGAEGGWVVCTVADAGPGFQAEDLPRVFDPFFTRRRGGTGLGLSIVERVVEAHGGYVAAANRPGGGALMTVRLPCVQT